MHLFQFRNYAYGINYEYKQDIIMNHYILFVIRTSIHNALKENIEFSTIGVTRIKLLPNQKWFL